VEERELWERQRALTRQYLERADFVRAAVFAWEAVVSRECKGHAFQDWDTRKTAAEALDVKFQAVDCDHDWREAFRSIRMLRNALAHGVPPQEQRFRNILASPERLRAALQDAIDRLLP
jgi:hypothetical protein